MHIYISLINCEVTVYMYKTVSPIVYIISIKVEQDNAAEYASKDIIVQRYMRLCVATNSIMKTIIYRSIMFTYPLDHKLFCSLLRTPFIIRKKSKIENTNFLIIRNSLFYI